MFNVNLYFEKRFVQKRLTFSPPMIYRLEMSILEAIMQPGENLRVSNGRKWLVFDDASAAWRVYHRPLRARRTRTLILTPNEIDAVATLLAEL